MFTTNRRAATALAASTAFALLGSGVAFADDVKNDVVVNGVDDTTVVGTATTVGYKLQATRDAGEGTGSPRCNATTASPVTVRVGGGEGVTAVPALLTFTECNVFKTTDLTATTPGSRTVSVAQTTRVASVDTTTHAPFVLHVAPRAASGLTATPGDQEVQLSWTASPDSASIDGYKVYNAAGSVIATVTGTTTAVADLTNDANHCFTVSAYKGTLTSAATSPACATPTAPVAVDSLAPITTLTATTESGNYTSGDWTNETVTVELSTDDPDATTYYRTSEDGDFATYSGPLEFAAEAVTTLEYYSEDEAGNDEDVRDFLIKIDTTAPEVVVGAVDGDEGENGWYLSDVTVRFTASDEDGGSGLADSAQQAAFDKESVGSGGEVEVASGDVADVAGNVGSNSEIVKIDKAGPSIVASLVGIEGTPLSPASNGWFNAYTGAPTVSFDCEAGDSPLAQTGCPASHLFGEGADQERDATVYAESGRSASDSVSDIYVDTVNPEGVAVTGVGSTTTFPKGATLPTLGCAAATDATSGIASQDTTPTVDDKRDQNTRVGDIVYTCSATDNAGNSDEDSVKLTVAPYSRSGILQPINTDGSSRFKLGSTIPVKVALTGGSAGFAGAVITHSLAKLSGTTYSTVNEASSTATPHTGSMLRHDTGGQYIFNLSTKSGAAASAGKYRLTLIFDDGSRPVVADFEVAK